MMSDAPSLSAGRTRAPNKPRHSLHLGRTFRSIMFAPQQGFESAFKIARRRARSRDLPVEGRAPSMFAAIAGMSLMLLWLKIGGLVDLRDASARDFRWSYLLAALVTGIVLGTACHMLWGWLAPRLITALRGESPAWQQRLIWGAAAFPQIIAVLVLLPLDLLLVGTNSFTTDKISETTATVWAALSISLSLALVAWSIFLLGRGVAVATEMDRSRVILTTLIAIVTVGVVFLLPIAGPVLL